MVRLIGIRLGLMAPTVLLATVLVFLLVHLMPGDPAANILGDNATPADLARLREQLGLTQSQPVQYVTWLGHALRLDFGQSLVSHEPVATAIARALPPTLQVVAGALLLSVLLGSVLGVLSARWPNGHLDRAISGGVALGIAIPNFWIGLILVSVFAVKLGWMPATGYVSILDDPVAAIRYAAMPALALGAVGASEMARQVRAAMTEIQSTEFIRTLKAAGLRSRRIVWLHALKNSAIPLVTIAGLQVNRLLGATVVIEAVFGIAGLGTLAVGATQTRDIPVVQGVLLVMVVMVVVTNMVVDILCGLLDPRVTS